MRIVSVVYGIASSMVFMGCVAGSEPEDTETADEIDSEGSAIIVRGGAPAAGAPGATIDPHECPPSLPHCGPVPGVKGTGRGDAPARAATAGATDPSACPASAPDCGPQPGVKGAGRGDEPSTGATAAAVDPSECPAGTPNCGPGAMPRAAAQAAGGTDGPDVCPPSLPGCGPQPGASGSPVPEPAQP